MVVQMGAGGWCWMVVVLPVTMAMMLVVVLLRLQALADLHVRDDEQNPLHHHQCWYQRGVVKRRAVWHPGQQWQC
jgi:hypothetical protein